MKNSIYYKILIGYIIFATLSLLLINTVISYKVMNMETARQAAELSSQADSVSSYCIKNNYYVHNSSNSSFNSSSDNYQKNMDRIPLTQDITLWIAGPANTILYSSFLRKILKSFQIFLNILRILIMLLEIFLVKQRKNG